LRFLEKKVTGFLEEKWGISGGKDGRSPQILFW
jgi:hypothetical protein